MTTDELNQGNQSASELASPRQAIAFVPHLRDFCGGGDAQAYFLRRLEHPFEGDGNVLVTGVPGSGKTHLVEAYLRERFHNPLLHNGDVEEQRWFDDPFGKLGPKVERAAYDIRFFRTTVPGKIYAYVRIDGASDSPKTVERKVADALYHESSDPETTLIGLRKALKPGGRLVLVEFRGEDPEVPIREEHKMTLDQAKLEVEPMGFTFKDSLEFLPWQHIIIFEKPAEKAEK